MLEKKRRLFNKFAGPLFNRATVLMLLFWGEVSFQHKSIVSRGDKSKFMRASLTFIENEDWSAYLLSHWYILLYFVWQAKHDKSSMSFKSYIEFQSSMYEVGKSLYEN